MFVTDKTKIVDTVYPLLSDHYRETRDRDYCLKAWWRNNRPTGGLSLSHEGQIAFTEAEIQAYEFELGRASYMGLLSASMNMDRKIQCPHYVRAKNKTIWVDIYDGRVAMNIVLYGDIATYVKRVDSIFRGD